MSLARLDPDSPSSDWDGKWEAIFDRYQNDLRHAHYVRAILRRDERSILEIGAGSFRDIALLARKGLKVAGMDFSATAVARARQRFPGLAPSLHEMSAFSMGFADGSFDLSYHNGFWVLFDDARIRELASEQARVTRRRMIATVHNAHNRQFVDYFERMKADDPLYDIRFFERDEISSLMEAVCTDVQVIPVGKQKQRGEDWLIRRNLAWPPLVRRALLRQGPTGLATSERLLCVGTCR